MFGIQKPNYKDLIVTCIQVLLGQVERTLSMQTVALIQMSAVVFAALILSAQ